MGRTVRILREPDVRAALDLPSCIDAVEQAFVAYTSGEAELPGVIHLDVPEAQGEIHVKAGHLHGRPAYAVKVASGFYAADPPAIDGMVVVFDARDGSPLAILLDGGYLTDTRTAAAGGVAARWLAPSTVHTVAVIGTGIQARAQVQALRVVRPGIEEVRVWGRDPEKAARAAADVGGVTAATVEEAVHDADVVVTCTASREPLVFAAWIKTGTHITAVGADGPGKQELDQALLRSADVLVVDSLAQCRALGELQHARSEEGRAVELGAICAGRAPGRSADHQLTVCDLTGVGVQDVAAAGAVLARAADRGEVIDLGG
jgi:ornithine cyclodeaminase/alanine dehydrogenase-like protein (mu-crystallin family)